MKKILQIWNSTGQILKIAIGLLIGAAFGVFLPRLTFMSIFGTLFVGALKAIAPVLVFILVVSTLASAQGRIGSRFRTVVLFYMITTFAAALVSVLASFIFPVTIVLDGSVGEGTSPTSIEEVLTNVLTGMVSNPVASVAEGNYVGILFWAILLGLGLKKLAGDPLKQAISQLSDVVSFAVRFIIGFAPFGVMGLTYQAVSENGLSIFTTYRKLLLLLVGCMLFVTLVVDPLIIFISLRRNPYPLVFKCLKESGLTAFFVRSSAANIPVNMELCKRLGLDPDFYSVSIPLGSTINMDGAAVTITVMTLAACHTLEIPVTFSGALLLSLLATLGACGASGVAGGSLLLIPMAASMFGISSDIAMQIVGVGFIISVVQDSVETALNSSGDVMFTATSEYYDRRKRGEDMHFLGK